MKKNMFVLFQCWSDANHFPEVPECPRKFVNGLLVGYHPKDTPFLRTWNNPLILTIDPNFQDSNGTSK